MVLNLYLVDVAKVISDLMILFQISSTVLNSMFTLACFLSFMNFLASILN
jgi:hypothetical protein